MQYVYTGTGMDLPLLEWLETHTFPVEARFKDTAFARKVGLGLGNAIVKLFQPRASVGATQ